MPDFSRWWRCLLFTSFSKTLLTNHRWVTGRYFLAVNLFPTFLNTGIIDETLPKSWKHDSCKQLLKSSAMWESSGSTFFKTTTGIQSGPSAAHESMLVINFLTNLGVIWILCSFRLVLEVKAGEEKTESSRQAHRKVFSTQFCLSTSETPHVC